MAAVDAAAEDVEQGHHVTLILDHKIERVAGSKDKGYALPRVELLELTSLSLESEPLFRLLLYGQLRLLKECFAVRLCTQCLLILQFAHERRFVPFKG